MFDNFRFDRFLFSLQYMWKGMLCIFAVIGVLILLVLLMNRLTEKMEALKAAKAEGQAEESTVDYLNPKISWAALAAAVVVLVIVALVVLLPLV